jgi:hypothetical protein
MQRKFPDSNACETKSAGFSDFSSPRLGVAAVENPGGKPRNQAVAI